MELLPTFLLAHLLADFPLQSNTIAANKGRSLRILFLHVTIHMVVLGALLGFAGDAWTLVLALGSAHFAVDWLKPRIFSRDKVKSFLLDQLAHLTTIVLIVATAHYFPEHELRIHLATLLLYPSLGISLVLALMVFLWVWINTLQEKVILQNSYLRWGQARLLEIEQYTGVGLLCVLVASLLWMH